MLKNTASEIIEFKKVLKEYTCTIKKAKAQQNLKNFHHNYKEAIKRKLDKSQEKHCNKISNIIKPSLFSIHSFDIFLSLYNNKNLEPSMKVIPTLYYNFDIQFFIRNEEKPKWTIGESAKNTFLASLPITDEKPICIFKPFNGKNKLFNALSCLETFMTQNDKEPGLYQHFIQTIGRSSSILLVHTKENTSNKYHIIKNKLEIPKINKPKEETHESIDESVNNDNSLKLFIKDCIFKYEKSIARQSTFGFAKEMNQLTNLETVEQSPNKSFSNLIERIKSSVGSDERETSELWLNENLNDKYTVNLKDSRSLIPYNVKIVIPEIESMVRWLKYIINKEIRKQFGNFLDEAELVFIKDPSLSWMLLKVKAIKCLQPQDYELHHNPSLEIPDSRNYSPLLNLSSFISTDIKPLIEKNTTKNKHHIRIRSIENLKAISSFQHHKKSKSINIEDNASSCINLAAQKCDILRYNARISQKPSKKLSEKYLATGFWKDFSVNFYRIILKTDISYYYAKFSNENFHAMSRATFRVFCCDVNSKFTKSLSERHKQYNISKKDYELFTTTFIKVVASYGIDEEDLKLIHTSFESVKQYIINES
ncbi:hypothetical protein SteCoe_19376 [Stentor coeruleus]|uniref:Uncharacterized protein n=1 Tax=Stentor coeruleus TaxID=5963 RepID=A0A1R2BU89_9CILI|nr:hypothetical protein SteCoe_19376 [Stentor coeruleus]